MLEEEVLEPIKARCGFSFKRIVKKNHFYIYMYILHLRSTKPHCATLCKYIHFLQHALDLYGWEGPGAT